jgi:drug/metabolite transporter (DMT)-like permease
MREAHKHVAALQGGNRVVRQLATTSIVALFVFVVCAWGLNWVVMKIVVRELTPLWAVALRTLIAFVVLLPAVWFTAQFIVPSRRDIPLILVISLFHMVAFAALMTIGLKYVSAGRAIVLGYTTPLWVVPAAWFFLKEDLPLRRVLGTGLGLCGLLLLFDPSAFNWNSNEALIGNGLIILAAFCWSVSIVCTRAHRWSATPFQLILWQTLVATVVLTALALYLEGLPAVSLSAAAVLALLYNGTIGTALGFWAMTVVNKELPATVASLGLLATPVIGLLLSAMILGEPTDTILITSSLLILIGIAVGTYSSKS